MIKTVFPARLRVIEVEGVIVSYEDVEATRGGMSKPKFGGMTVCADVGVGCGLVERRVQH